MRKFHFSLFFDYCDEVKKVAENVKDMDIIFFMGTTGCGKSTTIQYLCGS
jgi:ABC-type sugar transport system ATPase subunit